MEYSKAIIVGVHLNETNNQPQFLAADIVFIDQTNQALKPSLYELQGKCEPLENLSLYSKGSFNMLGEVSKIDKKKKMIYLSNQTIVQYKYLLILNKTSVQKNDETLLLKRLLDALKLQQKTPILLAANQNNTSIKTNSFFELSPSIQGELRNNIVKIARQQMNISVSSSDSVRPDKCLVEVQL